MKKYELWLDETGDFSAKEQTSGSKGDKVYSFIGGVLTPMDCISVEEASRMVGNEIGHATELDKEDIKEDLVPSLKELYDKGARFVFFENRKRYTRENQIDLYMEMMIDGIMQLLSFLAVFDKEFQLDIMIADRYAQVEEGVLEKISYDNYNENLKKMLLERIHYGFMDLDEDVKVNISYGSARKEPKLKLADYACGARRAVLRAHDNRYSKEDKKLLKQLFDENYVFDSYESSLMGQVKRKLSDNCLAEAILIYCNDKKLTREFPQEYMDEYGAKLQNKIKALIFAKMKELGKLEIRAQLEELLADINASIQLEDEYEWGEVFLHTLEKDFLKELKKYEIYDDRLDLAISFAYADLYRKEGDLKNFDKAIQRAGSSFGRLPQSLDFLWSQFRIWTLRQAYYLSCGDFENAKKWEEFIAKRSDELEEVLILAGIWEEGKTIPNQFQKETLRLKELRIYEEYLHGMAEEEELLELEEAIDKIDQGQMDEIRIFPKGCFYYLVDTGRLMEAFSWLGDFVGLEPLAYDETDVNVIKKMAADICHVLTRMDGRQKNELLREYLYLMKAMKEQEKNGTAAGMYSDHLCQALQASSILKLIGRDGKDQLELKSYYPVKQEAQYRHLVRSVLNDYQDKIYHPEEQIWWLLASYLELTGKDADAMNLYYNKAVQICEQSEDYAVMKKSLLAIRAERAGTKAVTGHKKSRAEISKVKECYESVINAASLPSPMEAYLKKEWEIVLSMMDAGLDVEVIGEMLLELSKKMGLS